MDICTTCSKMRLSSSNLSITLVLVYSVLSAIAGPPISPKAHHLDGTKQVSLQQYKGISRHKLQSQPVDFKQKQGYGIETKQRQQAEAIVATPFHLFSMYDKRGPWQPSFLPQAPPQPKAVKNSKVNQDVLSKGA